MISNKRRCASPLNTASPTSPTTSTSTAPVHGAARPEVIDPVPCETGGQLTDFSNVGSTTAIHDRVMMASVVVDPERTMDRRIGYLLMRLAVGFSLLGHGLVRIPKLAGFHAHLTSDFTHSILPMTLVSAAGYALPFVEFCIGAMVVVGLLTKLGLIAGVLSMTILVFGST